MSGVTKRYSYRTVTRAEQPTLTSVPPHATLDPTGATYSTRTSSGRRRSHPVEFAAHVFADSFGLSGSRTTTEGSQVMLNSVWLTEATRAPVRAALVTDE